MKEIDPSTPMNFEGLAHKPERITIGDEIDYYALFHALKADNKSAYMFESLAIPRHQDRYYTIGFDPLLEFTARGNTLTVSGAPEAIRQTFGSDIDANAVVLRDINPYDYLSQVPLNHTGRSHEGGLVGYLSYETVNYFEPSLSLPEHEYFPTFHFGLYADGLIYDSMTGSLDYYNYDKSRDRSEYVRRMVSKLDDVSIPQSVESIKNLGNSLSKAEHARAVEYMLENIKAGNSFQGEVGFKTKYEIQGDKAAIYHKLRKVNPSPYMYYVKFGDEELLGASPEILVSCTNGNILTTPTAGTTYRDEDPTKDRALARKLLRDPKEIAEHSMIVDLHRNDVATVSVPGSVEVSDLMYIIGFSHVQHIVSDVVGKLEANKNSFDLLRAIMPGGVVTGAPKIETIKLIQVSERVPRGPYGGAVGRFSMSGDANFALAIRSLFCHGSRAFTQTSSGVVFDSTPEGEYREVAAKLAGMARTISSCVPDNGENQ